MKISKPMTLTAVAVAGAIGLAALIPAFAANDNHGQMRAHGPAAFFEKMDADGDGKVTAEEMTAARAAEFTAADTNGDGFLSKDEILAKAREHAQARMEMRADKMIERGDADGDGKISLAEADQHPPMERMLARLDTDGDGAISMDELKAMRDHGKGYHKNRGNADQ